MGTQRNVTAVLGPTNTGKTHLAVERMIAHGSGMIGLPLRLLAREVYDRVVSRVGARWVALVTGEEKIVPPDARYWVCTVEAMPAEVDVAFLAIDEIQIATDLERGHVFTDRILHRRGRDETMLLGASTMRGMIEKLLPKTSFIARPRFSHLAYAGQKKLSRLPRRSAVVAFSAENVYAVAELIRRQRGGAAVVMGALSPRTRNAQAALYQSGDVDYIVATDAIGMGVNMDIDHVAFAATRKFDGFTYRGLTPAEMGQVAGRAGRYMNDGTFGVTGEADPLDQETVDRLENHNFEPVRMLQWRNRDLEYTSLDALKASLSASPRLPGLTRAQAGSDMLALDLVSREADTARLAKGREAVERLWEVCAIPDYRNISTAEHASHISRIYHYLMSGIGRIDHEWFARQLSFCARTEGDIDTLAARIAHVRTWTFVANRGDWLQDPLHWQGRAREIEDRLSDALHERLTQRFIDRRTSVLMRRLRQKEDLMSTVEQDGGINVEGEYVGHIRGFRFYPETAEGAHAKALKAAALQAVAREISMRADAVAATPDPDLSLSRTGDIIWQSATIARLEAGTDVMRPRVSILSDEQLNGPQRDAVQLRLERWLQRHIAATLEPLVKLSEAEDLAGISRGIAFRLVENLAVLAREDVAEEVKSLAQEDRANLRKYGVRFGAFHIFMPVLLKPAASELRLLLWSLIEEKEGRLSRDALPTPPGQGLTSVAFDATTPRGFYRTVGFGLCGPRAVRIDMLERLGDLIRERVFWRARFPEEPRPAGSMEGGGFTIIPDMMSLVGCSGEEFQAILKSLGFRMDKRRKPAPVVVVAPEPETPAGAPAEAVEAPAEAPSEPVEASAPAEVAAAEPAAPAEPEFIEVWWPKDTGPFRARPERKTQAPQRHAKPASAEGAADGPREARKPRGSRPPRDHKARDDKPRREERAPRPEKPIDKDSPFAVLGALKAQLSKKG